MSKHILDRIGKEEIYLSYKFEDAVIHIDLKGTAYVKLKGKPEFKAKEGSKLVTDARLDPQYISKSDYEEF